MIRITDRTNCCGCEACVNVCPQNCIEFFFDEEGFGYPKVDTRKCTGCNLCEEICPMSKSKENDADLLLGFIGKTNNEEILRSSASGGVFTQAAMNFLRDGGIVYGVAYNSNFSVSHIRFAKEEELYKLSGSKYVQSRMGDVYVQITNDLKNGKKVLFCGTPCQVNGVKSFIGNNDRLITIDIVCHAVPSPLLWKCYVSDMNNKYSGMIKNYNMRDKKYGYQFSHFIAYGDKEKEVYKGGTFFNQYLRAFFSGICNRPSCYKCRFKTIKRNSDITLGDCFYAREYGASDKDGACIIVIHTINGKEIIDNADIQRIPIEINTIVKRSKEITYSTEEDYRRKAFFEDLNKHNVNIVLDKYFPMSFIVYFKYYLRIVLCKIGLHDFLKRSIIRFRK